MELKHKPTLPLSYSIKHFTDTPTVSRPNNKVILYPSSIQSWCMIFQNKMYPQFLQKRGTEVVLCGDARFDSPGFSAKYCTYLVQVIYYEIRFI